MTELQAAQRGPQGEQSRDQQTEMKAAELPGGSQSPVLCTGQDPHQPAPGWQRGWI